MDNIKSYEAIARADGFVICKGTLSSMWLWLSVNKVCASVNRYNTPEEAWKACCVENGLV